MASVSLLGLVALAALVLSVSRSSPPEGGEQRVAASRALAIALVLQSVHFAEEAATGFHHRFPAVFGMESMPLIFFLAFNLAWIAIWMASVSGLRSGRLSAFFAAWFLALAGIGNGLVHPALALASTGYFPGLVSSPFVAGACLWLWLQLWAATRPA